MEEYVNWIKSNRVSFRGEVSVIRCADDIEDKLSFPVVDLIKRKQG